MAPAEDQSVLLRLPTHERTQFKDPLGPLFTDVSQVLDAIEEPVVAVGDVVSADLLEFGYRPRVAVIDGLTEREAVDESIADSLTGFERVVHAANPAGTITRSLTKAIVEAVDREASTKIVVDGEEDLAVVPAILALSGDGSVVYGQPGKGAVVVPVDRDQRKRMWGAIRAFDGDHTEFERLFDRQ